MINFATTIPMHSPNILCIQPVIKACAIEYLDHNLDKYWAIHHKDVRIIFNAPISIGNKPSTRTVIRIDDIISYELTTLQKFLEEFKPSKSDLCIDAGGRNHNGTGRAVYMHYETIRLLVEYINKIAVAYAA